MIVGGDALSLMPTCGGMRQCCQIAVLARQRVGLGSMGRTSSSVMPHFCRPQRCVSDA